jgi:hypothetical protein
MWIAISSYSQVQWYSSHDVRQDSLKIFRVRSYCTAGRLDPNIVIVSELALIAAISANDPPHEKTLKI